MDSTSDHYNDDLISVGGSIAPDYSSTVQPPSDPLEALRRHGPNRLLIINVFGVFFPCVELFQTLPRVNFGSSPRPGNYPEISQAGKSLEKTLAPLHPPPDQNQE